MRVRPWNVSWTLRNISRKVTGRKSLDQERREKMDYLREMLYTGKAEIVKPSKGKGYFEHLAREFTVDSVVVAKRDGSMLACSLSGGEDSAKRGQELYETIEKSLPDTKYLLIKSADKVHVVYPEKGLLYIVEAPGSISPIEVRALAMQAGKAFP